MNPSNDEQTELLRNIWQEMKALNSRIDKTNDRLEAVRVELKAEVSGLRQEFKHDMAELRQELSELRADTRRGFEVVGRRIDNMLLGEHGREHAELRERMARIETHLQR